MFLTGPFGESELRLALGTRRLTLKLGESLELPDAARNGLLLGLGFGLDDFGESLRVLLLCKVSAQLYKVQVSVTYPW